VNGDFLFFSLVKYFTVQLHIFPYFILVLFTHKSKYKIILNCFVRTFLHINFFQFFTTNLFCGITTSNQKEYYYFKCYELFLDFHSHLCHASILRYSGTTLIPEVRPITEDYLLIYLG